MPSRSVVMAVLLTVAFSAAAAEHVYDQIGIVKGQIFIVNNPELGRTPASGQYFVFQRTDCRRCLVGIRADRDGRYTAFLGVGRYRVICTDPEREGTDLIRKGQVREVTVKQRPDDAEFNIDLEIPRIPRR
ncbi:MAG: hypothetical protein LC114_14715 [Bryobacterales bacterium]|nr:hypothetical protein [Bryobacterales bacterium]